MKVAPSSRNDIIVDGDTARIVLCRGLFAVVDKDFVELLGNYRWSPLASINTTYAVTCLPCKTTIRMHRLLTNAPRQKIVDHVDGDGLNNVLTNLRVCGYRENNRNRRKPMALSSQYKGVYFQKDRNKWRAQISVDRKRTFLGLFDTEVDAAKAYNAAAVFAFGEFALLNDMEDAMP